VASTHSTRIRVGFDQRDPGRFNGSTAAATCSSRLASRSKSAWQLASAPSLRQIYRRPFQHPAVPQTQASSKAPERRSKPPGQRSRRVVPRRHPRPTNAGLELEIRSPRRQPQPRLAKFETTWSVSFLAAGQFFEIPHITKAPQQTLTGLISPCVAVVMLDAARLHYLLEKTRIRTPLRLALVAIGKQEKKNGTFYVSGTLECPISFGRLSRWSYSCGRPQIVNRL